MLTADHLLQAFEAAGADGRLVYVSVPITSGRREIALMKATGCRTSAELRRVHLDRWRLEVLKRNEADALILANEVRSSSDPSAVVVDPSRMSVTGWEQDDYNGFWVRLVDRFAIRLVASHGWAYSKGARQEVAYAARKLIPVTDASGRTLTLRDLLEEDRRVRQELLLDGWSPEDVTTYLPTFDIESPKLLQPSAASIAFNWLSAERFYQTEKFGTAQDDQHTLDGLGDDSWWWQQLTNYFHRSRVLGLDSPLGRQAIAKFAATACGLLESVIRVHGAPPPAGVASGTVLKDQRPS